jgi:acyl transferase domain-containing protein
VPFFSSVFGKILCESGTFDPAYWRSNLENPVLFNSASKLILDTQAQDHLFLEIGPHSALAGPIRQILKANSRKNDTYVTALERGKDCGESVLKMIGELYLQNIHINFRQVAPYGTVLTNMPLYQWCHDQEYWNESRVSRQWRLRKHPNHEILGSRTVEGNDLQPEWRNVLRLDNVPWLRDHQIINDIVFPCAGYLSMACEAIRQISISTSEDFTFRNVVIQTALVLSDSKSVEMITSLRPVRLTNTLNSVWWEFSISSFNGSIWIKHCGGQIRSGTDNPKFKLPHRIKDHPRLVPSPYSAMKKVGLNYGPAFQGLERLSALPKKMTASATLSKPELSESHYAIHPTTIDHCLQLFIVSTCEGTLRNINKLCVPTSIDQLYICGGKGTSGVKAEASGAQNSTGTISGDVVAIFDNEIILSLVGGQFSPIEENSSDESPDTVAGARLDWRPDLDFVQIDSLIRPQQQSTAATKALERLTVLSIIEIGRRISGLVTKSEYLEKFRSWINAQVQRASENRYDLVEDAQALSLLSVEERQMLIAELSKNISISEVAASGELISRVLKNCEDIVVGKVDSIEVLLPENGLTHFYDSLEYRTDCIDFFTAAGHSKPNLRVLEIGSGTGGTSSVVLRGLTSATQRLYSTYTYTDISSGFFVEAQERFKDYQGLEYKVLDISKDPTEQGFQDGSYDLIIAANVLHATPSLNTTLSHVRKLLAEDGRLFLQELSPQVQFANL